MKAVYLLPGLANDETIFSYLDLGVEVNYARWIEPLHKESIEDYAKRLAAFITEPDPILIGLSFGGMVSIEIAKHIPVKKIILLSSAKGRAEIPFYLRWLGKTGLQHIIPISWVVFTTPFTFWMFSLKKKEHKQLLKGVLQRSSHSIFRWSANAILTWKNETMPQNLVHIHGNADRVLPIRYIKADYTINSGGHFMLVTHANEVSALLKKIIGGFTPKSPEGK